MTIQNEPFLYKWEIVLYGGLLSIVVIDIALLIFSWQNPVLVITSVCSVIASVVVFLAHFLDFKFKELTITLYFVPLILMAAGAIDSTYGVFNWGIDMAGGNELPAFVPRDDYSGELVRHLWLMFLGPLVRLLSLICKRFCR